MERQVALVGKRSFVSLEARLVARPVHQVRRVLAIVDGELRIEPDPRRVFAQEAGADGVKRSGIFGLGGDRRLWRKFSGEQPLDSTEKLGRGAAREGRQHDPLRIGAGEDERRDPVGEHRRLARTGAGDDKQRREAVGGADRVLDGELLLEIELEGRMSANQGERHAWDATTFRALFARRGQKEAH